MKALALRPKGHLSEKSPSRTPALLKIHPGVIKKLIVPLAGYTSRWIGYESWRIIGVVPDFDDENIIPSTGYVGVSAVDQEGCQDRLFVRAKQDLFSLVTAISRTLS